MIEFDNDHLVVWKKLNKDEAKEFIVFLKGEQNRHEMEQQVRETLYYVYLKTRPALADFYCSASVRHKKDAEWTAIVIEEVKQYFDIKE